MQESQGVLFVGRGLEPALLFKPKLVSLPCSCHSIHHRYPLDSHPLCPTKSPNPNSKRQNRNLRRANRRQLRPHRNHVRNSVNSGTITVAASRTEARNRAGRSNASRVRNNNGAHVHRAHNGSLNRRAPETQKSASSSLFIMKKAPSRNFTSNSVTH